MRPVAHQVRSIRDITPAELVTSPGRVISAGARFGCWLVLTDTSYATEKQAVPCRCACGKEKPVGAGNLLRGKSTQCRGCAARVGAKASKHGHARGRKSPEYVCWMAMVGRCQYPSNRSYPRYGGLGIVVCDRWKDFANFLADMGPRPSLDHSIDRIDVLGNYEPANCRWATRVEQCNNKRENRIIEFNGRRQTMAQWTHELGFDKGLIRDRLAYGWSVERALTTPPRVWPGDRPRKERAA